MYSTENFIQVYLKESSGNLAWGPLSYHAISSKQCSKDKNADFESQKKIPNGVLKKFLHLGAYDSIHMEDTFFSSLLQMILTFLNVPFYEVPFSHSIN